MKNFVPFLILIAILTSSSCTQKRTGCSYPIVKSDDSESLEFWLSDTVFYSEPFLVRQIDTLYRYVRSNDFTSNNLEKNIEWMNSYRSQLCIYNDSTCTSDFDKADRVISESRKLLAVSEGESTMEMFVDNDIEKAILIFEQFNEFSRLYDVCGNGTHGNMLMTEFKAWLELKDIILNIYACFADMHYWGGSIRGTVVSAGILDIWQAHIDLYRKEYSWLAHNDDSCKDTGTFINPAKNLLLECCQIAFIEYDNEEAKNEFGEQYNTTVSEAKQLVERLPKVIDKWIEARKPWETEMSTDWLGPAYKRNTSEVLIKYANLISSVQ